LTLMATELGSFLTPFLKDLQSKQIMTASGDDRLLSFASSFAKHYVEKRRCKILNEARNLLLNNDFHNTVEVGVDPRPDKDDERLGLNDGLSVFKLHKSSISDTSCKLMALCRRTMDEAVSQEVVPPESQLALLPPTLYRTAREVLDMFRAIIPVTQGHAIANVPRTAAVLHNDCVFLAHNCQTLGLEYKGKFPPVTPDDSRGNLLRQTCIFVDMVPLFRDLAERSMADMLDLQAKQVAELVGSRVVMLGESLRSDEIVAEWSEAEIAIKSGLYHLRHLTHAWKPILSHDILNRSVGYLADIIFTLLLDQVAKASDISANACQFLVTQFEKVNNDISELVDGDKAGSRLRDRFLAVSGNELSKLVTSCFDDSPKRRNLLKLLSGN
jgi:protein transport protein DSL1/ZW10